VAALMDALEAACREGDTDRALARLRDLVPEYDAATVSAA